ncbi:ring-1,2-phenylacetyl-CoA epoxidase subunit PaaD [Haloactinopolyspora alba]|uniref:Ring-1,2-phenylacetyl-CoA epoxidase subunit PaaD n=1 Tax=Haloactinopolyspora alba TaxID=648780 RepID=A0A2P8DV84_9ACTN|nr:1,2-phenylacetyl-CoA epoxidase subunit PaaD [Haloactinopolyspora alba]PSL01104.1 ring-1,2-phenylacetyl-CoA epoxidase subunit PaaD [Haloactinopolyspora alba]
MVTRGTTTATAGTTRTAEERARRVAADVPDPELPMLTIDDLGILREVHVDGSGHVDVDITPTYSGCPALEAIRADVLTRLDEHGMPDATVHVVLSPPWTTDRISADGIEKLRRHGIAPPGPAGGAHGDGRAPVPLALTVRCPRCGSPDTRELARFGSTACKALWVCGDCAEPFDHLKAL